MVAAGPVVDESSAVFEMLSDGVLVRDAANRLIYANPAALRLIGFDSWEALRDAPPDEMMARFELFDHQGFPFPLAQLPNRRAVRGEPPVSTEIRCRVVATGEERWGSLCTVTRCDALGNPREFVTIFRDTTAQTRAARSARFLSEASAALAAPLDLETSLQTLVRLVVPSFADWCAVELEAVGEGSRRQVALAHQDPALERMGLELLRRMQRRPDSPSARVLQSGHTLFLPEVTDAHVRTMTDEPEALRLSRAVGLKSLVAVPLVARGHALGVLTLMSASGRRFATEDIALAQELGHRAAVAVDNVRLYQEARQVFTQLQRSEEQRDLAMAAAQLGYYDWDLSTRKITLSRSFEIILGVEPGSFDGRYETFLDAFIHPGDRERIHAQNTRLLEHGELDAFLFRIVRPDGQVRWLEGTTKLTRDAAGKPVRVYGMRADVTERKAAEERLRASEQRLRLALEAGQLGHWEWDVRTNLATLSPSMEAMHGIAPGSYDGTTEAYERLMHPEDRARMRALLQRLMEGSQEGVQFLYRVLLPDGSLRWLETQGAVHRTEDGRPLQLLGVCADVTQRHEAEAQLRGSEEQLRLAFQAGRLGFYDWDLVSGTSTISPEMQEMFGPGFTNGGLEEFQSLIHPEDRQQVDETLREMMEEGGPGGAFKYRILHGDGSVRWIDSFCKVLRDAAGRPSRMLGVGQDATQRMETEEKARRLSAEQAARAEAEASQRRTEAILDSISEPLFALDPQWRFRFLNRPAEQLVGKTREALVGRSARAELPFTARPSLLEQCERALRDGSPVDAEEQLADGSLHELRARPFDGGISLYLRDITARRREEEAQQRLARYEALRADVSTALSGDGPLGPMLQRCAEALIQHIGVAQSRIWTFDAQGACFELRAAAGRDTSLDGPFARLALSALDPYVDLAERYRTILTNDASTTAPGTRELARREGYTSYARFPLLMGEQVIGVMTMFGLHPFPVDMLPALSAISDALSQGIVRRRAEQALADRASELAQANAELGRSNSELEQFAYVASHDLQEPLRMVASFTELLSRRYKGQLDEKADRYITFSLDGVTRMQRLIQDLLTFSRVGTKGTPLVPVDLHASLQRTLATLAAAIGESHAEVTADPLPLVLGDEIQLEQLLQNLIVNAIKFRLPDVPPRVRISAQREGEVWTLAVRDNGIGIEPQYFQRIFVIFQRLHGKGRYPGTGIGLAICKKIVERHGGRLWVESAPAQGATFFFTLAAVPEQEPRSSGARET